MTLAQRWPVAGAVDLREALLAAWSQPGRGYHDTAHLAEVLDRLDELERAGADFPRLPVVLAAWFHDAVYDGRPDAEERSAQWAERALPAVVGAGVAGEAARLVRTTQGHRPAADDPGAQALCDADLAILAAGPERYAAYVAGVRREYAHLPDDAFAAGRGAVLRDLLAAPHLFSTAQGRAWWEAPARANVTAELAGRIGGSAGG